MEVFIGNRKRTDVNLPFDYAVAMGYIEGYDCFIQYGTNPLITAASDPETMWEYGGLIQYSTTADIVSISSSVDTDTQDIVVMGLDEDWNQVTQTVTLTGQTPATLGTPLIRCFRLKNIGTTKLTGTVYVYVGTTQTAGVPTNATDVRNTITVDEQESHSLVYTIPDKKVGFIIRGEGGVQYPSGNPAAANEVAVIKFSTRIYGGIFTVAQGVTVHTEGTQNYATDFPCPVPFPGKADLEVCIHNVSDSMGAWGTFTLIVVDEDKLPTRLLKEIGQIGY